MKILLLKGRRSSSTRSSYSIESDRSNSNVDELERILREKVRSQIHDVKTKFRHANDSDGNGKISRQSLHHLIASIFGTQKQISPSEIDQLLQKLHLKHLDKITFDQFLNSLLTNEDDLPGWTSRQSNSSKDYSTKRTAAQVFLILKEKARTKSFDLNKKKTSMRIYFDFDF